MEPILVFVVLQVLCNLPTVSQMADAKNLKKFLDKHERRAYRLVSLPTAFDNLCTMSSRACIHGTWIGSVTAATGVCFWDNAYTLC